MKTIAKCIFVVLMIALGTSCTRNSVKSGIDDELVKADNLIIHHSDTFGDTYHPHYRIIAKDIFEKEILPRL